MRIAICDPDPAAAKGIKNVIYAYAESRRLDLMVDFFASGEALLESGIFYRLILISYEQKGLNGLDTAKCVRKTFSHSSVIFLGNTPDFVVRSVELAPLQVLLKPVKPAFLCSALDRYFNGPAVSRPLWIKSGAETFCCTIGEILYLEADNKYCHVSLKNKKVPCHKTMARLSCALPQHYFLKISRAYIVNLIYIESYNKNTVRLTNGEALPVTKKYYNSFQAGFSAFCDPIII